MTFYRPCGFFQHLAYEVPGSDVDGADVRSVQSSPIASMERTSRRSPRRGSLLMRRISFVRRELARASEKVVRDPGVRVGACEMGGSVKRYDGLSSACRPRDAGWAREVSLDQLPLLGMEEDRPTLPRVLQCALQLFYIVHYAEAAPGVGVFERAFG